ncbi:U4/U6 small nuclear ribonucleoprotein prp4 [Physocladia obscura]|uniref:non-specific serine/threonine protein kinase n=1 Tax=Physocladia obscura TaxID=109957 RepID=A0AAD5T958_9FUNG|nr:U4/U6 small nuclear ribonucleoprotein prp4 [Physocladia obscura]
MVESDIRPSPNSSLVHPHRYYPFAIPQIRNSADSLMLKLIVKAYELRTKSKVDLARTLEDLKSELATLRIKQASSSSGQGQNSVPKITSVRKDIARVNTVISQVQRDQLRLFYKGAKYVPLDLRTKRTRAIRRRLTKSELSLKTVKAQKKLTHFPQRNEMTGLTAQVPTLKRKALDEGDKETNVVSEAESGEVSDTGTLDVSVSASVSNNGKPNITTVKGNTNINASETREPREAIETDSDSAVKIVSGDELSDSASETDTGNIRIAKENNNEHNNDGSNNDSNINNDTTDSAKPLRKHKKHRKSSTSSSAKHSRDKDRKKHRKHHSLSPSKAGIARTHSRSRSRSVSPARDRALGSRPRERERSRDKRRGDYALSNNNRDRRNSRDYDYDYYDRERDLRDRDAYSRAIGGNGRGTAAPPDEDSGFSRRRREPARADYYSTQWRGSYGEIDRERDSRRDYRQQRADDRYSDNRHPPQQQQNQYQNSHSQHQQQQHQSFKDSMGVAVRSDKTVSENIIESNRSDKFISESRDKKEGNSATTTTAEASAPQDTKIDGKQQPGDDATASGDGSNITEVAVFGEEDTEELRLIEERRKRRLAILQKYHSVSATSPPTDQVASFAESPDSQKISSSIIPGDELSNEQTESKNELNEVTDLQLQNTVNFTATASIDGSDTKITMGEAEISAADYDPNQDGANDQQHRQKKPAVATATTATHKIANVKDDDDIFNPKGQINFSGVIASGTNNDVEGKVGGAKKKGKKVSKKDAEFDMFAEDDMFALDADLTNTGTTHILESAVVVRSSDNPALIDNWDDSDGYYREVLDSRYHVYQNLGRGVFSSVVKARDTKNGDVDVAIKVIRNNDTMHRAGMKEISILKKLAELDPDDKKHVIRLVRHFEHKNHLCMVFESMSMNLREVLKKFGKDIGLNIKAVRIYAQQLLLSLSLLRKGNILHADIKPDNILVSESKNTLKLCDLGSASDASENEITPYLVSRFYRAPEIIIGLPYDFSMDMWSIACTLYELYTGKILFPGRSNNQMLRYMQEVKGPFPKKMLRKGQFTNFHFDESLNFLQIETTTNANTDVGATTAGAAITTNIVRPLAIVKASKDIKTRLIGGGMGGVGKEEKEIVGHFVDFLERSLNLAPEGRLTVKEALVHPFIVGTTTNASASLKE